MTTPKKVRCPRCEQEVEVITPEWCMGPRLAKHSKSDGTPCVIELKFEKVVLPRVNIKFPDFPK